MQRKMYEREQTTLDGKTHKVVFFKDKNGVEKTISEIRSIARNTFEGLSRAEVIDIILIDMAVYDLIDYAQDENNVWYDE